MMGRTCSIAILSWVSLLMDEAAAQWAPAGVPFQFLTMTSIYADPVTDGLYCFGESSLNNDNNYNDAALPVYWNGQWDTLAYANGGLWYMVRYGDTLVLAGNFTELNGQSITAVAGFSDGVWFPMGSLENFTTQRLRVLDDELYVVGSSATISSPTCRGVARWNSDEWESVGCLADPEPIVCDIIKWNGRLCITGVINLGAPGTPRNIAYLDANEDWVPIGPGLLGSISAGRSLAVYGEDLYVSGSIPIQAGNAGHGIMRWDGQQFHPVGTGLQGPDNGYVYSVGALEMQVHDGLLWAAGTFYHAGHVPAPGIATWDGAQWCGLPLGPAQEINSIEFYHDTLFATCFHFLDGVDVNCAVRYVGDTYADTCGLVLALPGPAADRLPLRAMRRVDGTLELLGLPMGTHAVGVQDANGRTVWEGVVRVTPDTPVLVDLPALSAALYIFRIGTVGALRFLGP